MSEIGLSGRVAQSEEYNFVAFAQDQAYREANRQLLARAFAHLPSPFFQVDVASGTGLVPQEISALCQAHAKHGTVIGLDPDRFAVESARRSTPSNPHCTIEFVEGRAQDMAELLAGRIPAAGVDYVSIHDALHEIEEQDKPAVLRVIARLLRPGGIFSYNSAFTSVAMEVSAVIWGRWKARAFAILGGRRNREVKGLITHTPEEYRQMIAEAGLAVIHEAQRTVQMSRRALETIARYPRFVCGVFADLVGEERISLAEKSRALIAALDDLQISEVPRVWHELLARKPNPA